MSCGAFEGSTSGSIGVPVTSRSVPAVMAGTAYETSAAGADGFPPEVTTTGTSTPLVAAGSVHVSVVCGVVIATPVHIAPPTVTVTPVTTGPKSLPVTVSVLPPARGQLVVLEPPLVQPDTEAIAGAR